MERKKLMLLVFLFTTFNNVHQSGCIIRAIARTVRTVVSETTKGVNKAVSETTKAVNKAVTETVKGVTKGVDIVTKGCCGLHPSYCTNRKEFEDRQNDIKRKSAQMDKDWILVKEKMNYVKTVNINNQEIYRNVRRVTLVSTLAVQTLDPNILEKINNVTNEIKKALIAKNQTVVNYGINEIGKEIEKTEETSKTELLDASGIGGFSMAENYIKMSADMFRLVKLDSVARFLEGDVLGLLSKAKLEVSKLFGFHYLEKLAENNKALQIMFTALKFYNDYINIFNSAFKVMELFGKFTAWITDLATCEIKRKELESALKNLRVDHAKINESFEKLKKTKTSVDQNWNLVFNEAKSSALLTNLKEIEKIAIHSSSASKVMKDAADRIKSYRLNIAKSTPEGVSTLQGSLINALSSISYNVECYQRKLATLKDVTDNCRLGTDSLENLYTQALQNFRTNLDECEDESGLPYTSFVDVQMYVKKKAQKLKFESECLLNSGLEHSAFCKYLHHGYSILQASKKIQVNKTVADSFESTCTKFVPSPKTKEMVCQLKPYKSVNEVITLFGLSAKDIIPKIYEAC